MFCELISSALPLPAMLRIAIAGAMCVVGRAAAVEDLVRVPGTGQSIPRRCILEVPNGATHDYDSIPAGLPAGCNGEQLRSPSVQIYAADTHLKSSEALTSFTADWVVPPLPKRAGGQVVYFWPGFKNSKPEMGYPVLQPVLQYGEHGPGWQLQSWFVDANDHKYPVVTAPAITVEPGHQITSFMVQTDDGHNLGWTVSGTNINTGANSTLHIAYSKAGDVDYDYAMLVNENINVNTQCDRMPASTNVSFSKVSVNGESKPQWTTRANCAGNPQCDCGNAAAVDVDTGDVTLSWKYE
jgi:hypothetical protein